MPKFFPYILLLSALQGASPCHAQHGGTGALEGQVRVGFIFNFAKYIEWPNEEKQSELRCCFLKANKLGDVILALDGQIVRDLKVKVLVEDEADIPGKGCALLYLGQGTPSTSVKSLEDRLRNQATAIVSEDLNYGTIRLFQVDNKLRFSVSAESARAKGLKLSSQLLSLSRPLPE